MGVCRSDCHMNIFFLISYPGISHFNNFLAVALDYSMPCYIPIMNRKNIAVGHGYGLSLLSLLIFGLCSIQHSRAEEGKVFLYTVHAYS